MIRVRDGGEAGLDEDPPGDPLVLVLHVDRGQHAVGAHAAQQPDAADPGTGADLDHGLGAARRGEQAQHRAGAGVDAAQADLVGQAAGGLQDDVLGGVRLGELQRLRRRRAERAGCGDDDDLRRRGCAVRNRCTSGMSVERCSSVAHRAVDAISGHWAPGPLDGWSPRIRVILDGGAGARATSGGTDVTDGWNWRQPRPPPAPAPARRQARPGGPTRSTDPWRDPYAPPPWSCRTAAGRHRPAPEPVADPDAPRRLARPGPADLPGHGAARRRRSAARSGYVFAVRGGVGGGRTGSARRRQAAAGRPAARPTRWPAWPSRCCPAWSPSGSTRARIGSGFVVSADGYVITNDHVVEGAGDTAVGDVQRRLHRRRRRWSAATPSPTSPCSRSTETGLHAGRVRRLRRGRGRRPGARLRLAAGPGQHGHRRHRQRPRPHHPGRRRRAARSATTRRSRPTPRSTRATPAARWSTPPAG